MNEENIKSDDYIGLPPFKKLTIQFLRFIFSIVDLFFDVINKSKLLLLAGLIAGLALGYYYYTSRSSNFEVSMIAQSSAVHRKTLMEMIQALNELIVSHSYVKMANELNISEQDARQLKYLELTGLLNENVESDTSSKFDQPFKITAKIGNTNLTDTFQNALVNYLDNKPALKKINEEQVKFRNEKLAFINMELAKLDTLTTVYNRYLASSKITTTYYINEADPSKIYKQATDLIDEKGIILNWLGSNSKPIQVIDEFKSPLLPRTKYRFKTLAIGALIGLGFCFLLGLYIELHRKIRNYEGKA
jgi:hypothetical protein